MRDNIQPKYEYLAQIHDKIKITNLSMAFNFMYLSLYKVQKTLKD